MSAPAHISTVPAEVDQGRTATKPGAKPYVVCEPHGLCVCSPKQPSTMLGECTRCHRLDPNKAAPR